MAWDPTLPAREMSSGAGVLHCNMATRSAAHDRSPLFRECLWRLFYPGLGMEHGYYEAIAARGEIAINPRTE